MFDTKDVIQLLRNHGATSTMRKAKQQLGSLAEIAKALDKIKSIDNAAKSQPKNVQTYCYPDIPFFMLLDLEQFFDDRELM